MPEFDGVSMPFGKYEGADLEWIVDNDPGYAQWVVRTFDAGEYDNGYIIEAFEGLLEEAMRRPITRGATRRTK